jgi:subtilisin family serine protease
VENDAEATFNIDDIGTEDDIDGLDATDTVKVLMKKTSDDVVYPASFSMSLNLSGHNIVAGTMTKKDYEKIQDDPNVKVEIDHEVHVLEEDHDTNLRRKLSENTPYGISMVLQDMDFWSDLRDPNGTIKVCVADTGYDLGHEDTPKDNDVTGTDNPEYSNDRWDRDPHGHGTHCSGTVSALGGNDKGVVGVIPNNAGERFQLVIANSLTGSGSGSWSGVVAGVDTCVSNGAKVVSLSLGGYFYSAITEEYYKDLYENQGILFVAAAGNGGNTNKLYPASYPSLMSVAAIDSNKNKASFSTFNDQVEISAPGVLIESSLPGNTYAKWSGTSMATPHVAGVAGLLWMHFPDCKNYQIRNAILATAEDLRDKGCDIDTGFGVVRAKAAYELLAKGNCGGNLGVTDGETGGCDQLTAGPAPTSAPVPSAPSTSYPTHTAPTMYPTHTAPTPYPTEAAPTSRPTGKTCADVLETCKKHADCCTKRCNRIKGECRAARKFTKAWYWFD